MAGIKKKSNGNFVRVIEEELNADDVLNKIQIVKRNIDNTKTQLEYLTTQLTELENEYSELTATYKQLI